MTAASLPLDSHGNVDQLYIETRELRLQGFLLFLVSDCVLFASFIFAYLYLRNSGQGWPPPGIQRLDVAFAAWNSVVLFGSGATMHYALENFKHGNFMRYMWFLLATIVLGAGFLGGQAYEYTHLIYGEHVTWWGSGIFGASFFTLTGMHGMHVFIGVCYLTVLVLQSAAGVYTRGKFFGITAGTLYWHFVDVIWVVLFSIFYLL
ncbi:MAG: heme-copper oxidase subunit III [Candidatus Eremiobacteraeota bacterium]|nr:heme-copper oxidase subunit III [Candidatus Eremiobacteraeota bacterium]MBV8499456.1 heme-copper oxidase subunit III [Candidatus Eremiobacteraeota bacterium]